MPDLRLYAHDGLPTRMPAEAEEYVLTPGSVLYVPRGFWHETESDEASISLHVHHIPVPWVDAVLVTLRAKLLRDPAWRAGAHDLWDTSRRSHTAATADRLLDALAAAVDGLTADDVLPTPGTPSQGVQSRHPVRTLRACRLQRRYRRRERPCCLVTFSVFTYGTERRTTLEMSPLYLDACRCFVAPGARGGLSARDLASLVPGLSVDEGLQLIRRLLDVGFVRPAMAVDAWEGRMWTRHIRRVETVGQARPTHILKCWAGPTLGDTPCACRGQALRHDFTQQGYRHLTQIALMAEAPGQGKLGCPVRGNPCKR